MTIFYILTNFDQFWPILTFFDDFVSKLIGKIVILKLSAIDSASFYSNLGNSVEMGLILSHFDQFLMILYQNLLAKLSFWRCYCCWTGNVTLLRRKYHNFLQETSKIEFRKTSIPVKLSQKIELMEINFNNGTVNV